MKRPLCWMAIPVIFLCIMRSVFCFNAFLLFFILTAISAFLLIISKNFFYKRILRVLIIFTFISFIFVYTNGKTPEAVDYIFLSGNENIMAEAEGIVEKRGNGNYILKNTTVFYDDKSLSAGKILVWDDTANLIPGDVCNVTGKFTMPEVARNPGNFNARAYYESEGIYISCNPDKVYLSRETKNPILITANNLRNRLKDVYLRISPQYGGILSSMIIGDRSELDDETKDLYRENGIAHLLAISGLHVSMTGLILYNMLKKIGAGFTLSSVISGAFIIFYGVLTGNSVSTVRAVFMFILSGVAEIKGRTYDGFSAAAGIAIINMLFNPKIIFNMAFLMSYTSVIFIYMMIRLMRMTHRSQSINILFSNFAISLGINLGLLPINIYTGYEAIFYPVLLNLIVIPLSQILLPLGMAAGIAGMVKIKAGVFFAGGAEYIFKIYDNLCLFFEKLPFGRIICGHLSIKKVYFYYLVIVLLIFFINKHLHKRRLKILMTGKVQNIGLSSVCLIAVIIFTLLRFTTSGEKASEAFIAMMDVGQGDSILIHTANGKNYLFDGGSTNIKNVYSKRMETCLKYYAVSHIDAIFISHSDADHVNGIIQLLEKSDDYGGKTGKISVGSVILPEIDDIYKDDLYRQIEVLANHKKINLDYAKEGISFENDGCNISCISPGTSTKYGLNDINSLSAVYKVEVSGLKILMTGDISAETEKALIRSNMLEDIDILKVAHHGSDYSNSAHFLSVTKPEIGIVSCAKNNRYGHPGKETVKRLDEHKVKYYVTKDCGHILITKNNNKIIIKTML